MSPLRALALAAALAALPAVPTSAGADVFGGISLMSESPTQQVEYAHDAAVSADGRYVAFDGSFGGVTGVWRRDVQSGAVEQVAGGDAELPSISQDGRYISFTTTAALSPGDHNAGPDAYVRDMGMEAPQPGAYALASAVNGSEEGLTYAVSSEYGSQAAGRSALSADGRTVAFVTTAVSNLVPDPELEQKETEEGIAPRPHTPALQVAVRNLDAHTTELVSAVYPQTGEPKPVSAIEGPNTVGAVYAEGGVGEPPRFKAVEAYATPPSLGASISADGSTVAWLGQNVGEQAPTSPGENLKPEYAEQLWRRIADGPSAATRRVAGGAEGPFAVFKNSTFPGTWAGGPGEVVPRLSSDGFTVAFLANASLTASGSGFGNSEHAGDVYVANMHDGGIRPLTELASGENTDIATTAPILDVGISADGTKVAFTTKRTVFPLGSPAFVSAPAPVPGMSELYDVDLQDDTLTRVTQGFEGGPSEHPHKPKPVGEDPYNQPADGALSPSFSADGNLLAFSSTAANLVYGDGNTPPLGHESKFFDGSDAFLVARRVFSSTPTEAYVSSPPPAPGLVPAWRLGATAFSRRDGSVLLEIEVPGVGTLRAGARASVRVLLGPARSSRRSGRRRAHRPAILATRTVASRDASAHADGLLTMTLKLAPRYRTLAGQRGGLSATVNLLFTAPAHPTLKESLTVSFRRIGSRAKRANVHRRARRRGHR